MFGFRKFLAGINLIPKATSNVSARGDLDVSSTTSKINYHNGTSSSPLVTEAHSATLSNKTIDAASNTISNISNTEIKSAAAIDASKIADGSVSSAEFQYLDGVTSAIQTQINSKQPTGNYVTVLTGDVTATGPGSVAATVVSVGGSSAANVHSAELIANAATDVNTASTVVKRDSSGNFSAGNITASLSGNVTGDVTGNVSGTSLNVTGTVAINHGGTGQTAKTAAFGALSPLTSKADIVVHDGTNNTRLPVGANSLVLTADSSQTYGLRWGTIPGGSLSVVSKTADYTLLLTDDLVLANSSGGTFTLTLPTAVGNAGKLFRIKVTNSGTNFVLLQPSGSETLDNIPNLKLGTSGDDIQIISDGSNWQIVSNGVRVGFKYSGSTQSIITGSQVMLQPTFNYDPQIGYNSGTGVFTIKMNGLYRLTAYWQANAITYATNQDLSLAAIKNGAGVGTIGYTVGSGSEEYYLTGGSTDVACVYGDQIYISISSSKPGTGTGNSFFAIHRVGP